jgi:hypothetical protein
MVVFRVRIQGRVLCFLGISIACAVMASAFGLLIAALGNSSATARGVTTLAVLMMVMLDGTWGSPLTLGPGPSKRQVQSTVTNARNNFSRTYTAKQYSSLL